VWLPNERVARAWTEYLKTGAVSDSTPPPAPVNVTAVRGGDGITLEWTSAADLDSGIGGFIIERDGTEIARLPEKPVGRFGRPLFQRMSYHDTPERPVPELRFIDKSGQSGKYQVIAINSAGVKSKPSKAVQVR
jgi:hypothetical protein